MKKTVSVVIPNYNGKKLLEMYLPSVIEALKSGGVTYELIIVDDYSKDDSVEFISTHYPDVKLLINKQNKGFSATCNHGIAEATMELTFLLNSDVQLTPDYFASQWKYFQFSDTFGVMGRIMSKDGKRIEDAARILYYSGCRIKANRFYYKENPDELSYTAYLSGANALVDTKKLKELGGFDEIFSPFSSEDSDLSTRAWLLGWKCYYDHSSVCYHQVSGSIRKNIKSRFVNTIYFRNRFIFQQIHLSGARSSILPAYIWTVEVLAKLMIGKFWILESYRDYLSKGSRIRASKSKLNALKAKYASSITLEDIMETINASIAGRPIIKVGK
jgi:GT2 family glycosyltransferase